ncbi:MAG: N-acetyl-gamma-glutamyl-phosphate reductase [Actinobacteria bacterium HGW-Actinobacteria-10]|jgi:N-acetyl-gamma-glutamyl-phosphate reductase|nr:MAG: N-acetyl-gamma-glutamyl-phosphate reductase [Actinobacteria bacterium HGW-Actinobacteria-10]
MVDVAIVGAPGYAGIELTRLVLGHPEMHLAIVTSAAEAGRRIDDVYPQLSGLTDLAYTEPDVGTIAEGAHLVFLAVPHTAALAIAPALLGAGLTVVDASADYRLQDAATYESWYGTEHTSPELLSSAVYGLPELDRSGLAGARLVACPGCYPTAALLAAAPALEAGIVTGDRVLIDAKSGVSGAGRSASAGTHFPTVNESLQPYKVSTHRHTPEIEQGLSRAAGRTVGAVFVPHLVPMTRGLLATVYLDLVASMSTDAVVALYRERYEGEPFIRVHDVGRMPSTAEVRGTNRAHIGIAVDPSGVLVVACAIDNLVKGTAGQAVQCANLALGFPETAGLIHPAPVV